MRWEVCQAAGHPGMHGASWQGEKLAWSGSAQTASCQPRAPHVWPAAPPAEPVHCNLTAIQQAGPPAASLPSKAEKWASRRAANSDVHCCFSTSAAATRVRAAAAAALLAPARACSEPKLSSWSLSAWEPPELLSSSHPRAPVMAAVAQPPPGRRPDPAAGEGSDAELARSVSCVQGES